MTTPIISFVCWNRAGLTARNLNALLNTTDDFELYIIDSNSKDDTWKFIETLNDSRIKEIKKLDFNRGCPYAANYVMSKRKNGQFFIHVDSDSYIITKDWITKFMEVMNTYPEIGAACTVSPIIYERISRYFNTTSLERNNVTINQCDSFFAGNCLCIRPEVMDRIGYFNEETGRCDNDYGKRLSIATDYKIAFVPQIIIDQTQKIECDSCYIKDMCTIRYSGETCFELHDSKYQNMIFDRLTRKRFNKYIKDVEKGIKSAYCASIHDEKSMENYDYNKELANENFKYYIDNAN